MRKSLLVFLISLSMLAMADQGFPDDTALFTTGIDPDVAIILDLSGSMRWTPTGATMFINPSSTCAANGVPHYPQSTPGTTKECTIDPYGTVPKYSDVTCSGPFYTAGVTVSGIDYKTDCSRLGIAKRSLFDLLDDNDNGNIDTNDENSLDLRFAYMNFYNCSSDDTGGDYASGCIKLIRALPAKYSDIESSVNSAQATGGTPLSSALNEVGLYLNASKTGDTAAACRKKFAILITDGADTYACGGNGSEGQTTQYKRRRESVAKAKALTDLGYMVFIVGFGATMPHYLINTLNWMAFYGGSDNQDEDNSGDPAGYDPTIVTSCQDSSTASHDLGDGNHYYATSNDPGEATLTGYAFLATNADQLTASLKKVARLILQKAYSFTVATMPSLRLVAEDNAFISYFVPNNTSFWKGNLKAYRLNADGTFPVDENGWPLLSRNIWDPVKNGGAGEILEKTNKDARNILTYVNGAQKSFIKDNLSDVALDISTSTSCSGACDDLIKYVRGENKFKIRPTEDQNWKLGDMFHSNAVIVGSPSPIFEDQGFSGTGGFYELKKNRTKIILVGANDGMLHAFDAATGAERWGFIPNGLLKTLKLMKTAHTYYVDSTPEVSDVWFYSSDTDTTKTADEWKTILVVGYRKGGKQYMALNITDTLNPVYLWEFPNPTDTVTLGKVGQSWSEPAIGRVKIEVSGELYERWVAFIGGGFDMVDKGRAFFVVDLKTGNIIKEFSGLTDMSYGLAAPPTMIDLDMDGYVDRVYIGDLGGQLWVFDVSFNAASKKSNSLWSGAVLFKSPNTVAEKHPIYGQVAVALDENKRPWVFYGTGDKENPKDLTGPQERFYALRDDGAGTYPMIEDDLAEKDLSNVTNNNTFIPDLSKKGWFLKLEKGGFSAEKAWDKPVVFNRLLYFTTYTYTQSTDPCTVEGFSKLYILEFRSGGGAFNVTDFSCLSGTPSDRSIVIGSGTPSSPTITLNLKGIASITTAMMSGKIDTRQIFSTRIKSVLYWREVVR